MKSGLGRLASLLLIGAASAALASCQKPIDAGFGGANSNARILVSDERGDAVVVVDPGTGAVIRTVAVGRRPRGILLSPDGAKLYVALSGSAIAGPGVDEDKLPAPDRTQDGIAVVNLSDFGVGARIAAGNDPETFAITPDGQVLLVANEDTSELSIVDLATGEIRAHVKIGDEPEGVAVTPDGKTVYVACEGSNAVYVVDLATAKVKAIIKMEGRPRAVVFTKDGSTAYVSNEDSGQVSVLDAAKNVIKTVIAIPEPGPAADSASSKGGSAGAGSSTPRPMGLVFSPDGSRLYVTTGRGGTVAEIETATNAVGRLITDVGERPWGIAVSTDGKHLYTANGPSGDISVIDAVSGKVDKRIKVGQSPWGVAFAKAS